MYLTPTSTEILLLNEKISHILDSSDWISIGTTIILASTAFLAPYIIEKWKYSFYSAKLTFKFIHSPPYCHKTEMRGGNINFSVYYFRFIVANIGKTQADQCEVVLEKIWKENSAGILKEYCGFSPVSLKWSGTESDRYYTIQPQREFFCDIGRIHNPKFEPTSAYKDISENEKNLNKFFFELPKRHFSQWDCLTPGKYEIELSVYSKNAKKITKKFKIVWSGNWKDQESDMLNELVIS